MSEKLRALYRRIKKVNDLNRERLLLLLQRVKKLPRRFLDLLRKLRNRLSERLNRRMVVTGMPIHLKPEQVATDIADIVANSKAIFQARRKVKLYCELCSVQLTHKDV